MHSGTQDARSIDMALGQCSVHSFRVNSRIERVTSGRAHSLGLNLADYVKRQLGEAREVKSYRDSCTILIRFSP